MKPRILILADGGPEVGGGHLMRCLSLARALTGRGAACAMIEHPPARRILGAFAPASVERLAIDGGAPNDMVAQTTAAADRWGARAVIVDHYGLNPVHESRLRGNGRRIVVIDDLARPGHDADLLVDPSLGRGAKDYPDLQPAGARVLGGPEFALLREDYAAARSEALARRRARVPVSRLLVSLGLTDLRGVTGRVLQLLKQDLEGLGVDVVVGSDAPSLTWLKRLAATDPNIVVHVDASDMPRLISQADIGVGAGGSSVWERACLGLPALNLILAENQQALATGLERQGACLAVDARQGGLARDLGPAFLRLRNDPDLRLRMSEVSAALCDGLGAGRVADAIVTLVGQDVA